MKRYVIISRVLGLFLLTSCLVFTFHAQAVVNTLSWYHLGESDVGSVTNGATATMTADSAGNQDLTVVGGPTYDTNVASVAAVRTGSSLSLNFNGGNQRATNGVLTGVTNNFGIEAWVLTRSSSGSHVIVNNGVTGNNGWGLRQLDTNFFGVLSGVTNFGVSLVATNVWTHLALVNDNGISTFYANGIPAGTTTAMPITPQTRFGIGGQTDANGGASFLGNLDEVRVFTFAPGQFRTNDLLYYLETAPVVTTLAVDNLTTSTVRLNASVIPGSTAAKVYFNYGSNIACGITSPITTVPAGFSNVNVSFTVTGLASGWGYFQALATNVTGSAAGAQLTFAALSATTNVGGTVYAPNGADPVNAALVYVPNGAAGPPTYGVAAFPPGVQSSGYTGGVTGAPLVSTYTAYDGTFTLTNLSYGTNVPLVIQAGRWRRKITITNLLVNTTTVLSSGQTRFPTKQAEFDPADNIPLIAVATGADDTIECLLRKMGISDTEFGDPGGNSRVQFYLGDHGPGAKYSGSTPSATNLFSAANAQSKINQYDLVLFPCPGAPYEKPPQSQQVIINYANAGGRIIASHESYVWLYDDQPFQGTASWNLDNPALTNQTVAINQAFPRGLALAEGLQTIGASTTLGQIFMTNLRYDFDSVSAAGQPWLSLANGGRPILYSFDTPIGNAVQNQYGRVIYCDFHVEGTTSASGLTFPAECTGGPMTPQDHVVEFMLFNYPTILNPNFPVPVTLAATSVSATTSTLNATVNPSGYATSTYFQYGLTTNYGGKSATNNSTGTKALAVSNSITGLVPGTTYHYQLVAYNDAGTRTGADLTFTTVAAPPVILDPRSAGLISGGAFQFSFTNLSGLSFSVLSTTNLQLPLSQWTRLGTAVESPAGSGTYRTTDTQNTNQAAKFYRVSLP